MLIIHTALHAEARALIQYYGLKRQHDLRAFACFSNDRVFLIESGIGKIEGSVVKHEDALRDFDVDAEPARDGDVNAEARRRAETVPEVVVDFSERHVEPQVYIGRDPRVRRYDRSGLLWQPFHSVTSNPARVSSTHRYS